MSKQQVKPRMRPRADAFSGIAMWQFMTFLLLLCYVWVHEYFDLTAKVFDTEPEPFSPYRAFLMSAAVITAGVITVGHTYERQRSLVRKLLMTCLYCHRVKTDEGSWMHVEEYFLTHFPVDMERGACPECEAMLKSVGEKAENLLDKA